MSAHGLAARIETELSVLDRELARATAALMHFQCDGAAAELDSAALRLQLWYTGFETLVSAILIAVDGDVPAGAAWHRELLDQAMRSTTVREALLPQVIRPELDQARAFRHRVRNAYGVEFDPTLLGTVIASVNLIAPQLRTALQTCAQALRAAGP